jgi:hypothetical protein
MLDLGMTLVVHPDPIGVGLRNMIAFYKEKNGIERLFRSSRISAASS